MGLPTADAMMRNAEWHATRALLLRAAGNTEGEREHMQSALEWLQNAGLDRHGISDPTEIYGLIARARTGILE